MDSMEYTVQAINLSKRYRIGHAPLSLRSLLGSKKYSQDDRYHWAVKDVCFGLKPGESLGIIGPNGAGKTTILKLLSRITYPTEGEISMDGRFSALIELGAGFHPDLTGRENIFLNGTILGMRREEIQERFDRIVEFAGIGDYLDTPVKRYSSGMYARLGFSVAAHVDPEILLVDEVLAVGDMAFQKKCYDHMLKLRDKGTTLIFISHNLQAIQRVCSSCMVMYRGHKVFEGSPAEATAEYSNIIRRSAVELSHLGPVESGIAQRVMTHKGVIRDIAMLNQDGEPALTVRSGETVRVRAKIAFHETSPSPVFACLIQKPDGQFVYNYTTYWADLTTPTFEANTTAEIEFSLKINLVEGMYYLGLNLAYSDLSRYYDRIDRALDFFVVGGDGARGVADLRAQFKVL